MKKTIALTIAAVAVVAAFAANRSVELSSLENLQALEQSNHEGTKAALTWVNENALDKLPVAATLRAEDAVAGVAMRMSSDSNVTVAIR